MRRNERGPLHASAWVLGVVLLGACGQTDPDAGAAAPATEVEASTEVRTAEALRAATAAITAAADENGWALSAVSRRPDMTGLIVEVMGEDPQPRLEASIRASVEVPLVFRYGGGPAIERLLPAKTADAEVALTHCDIVLLGYPKGMWEMPHQPFDATNTPATFTGVGTSSVRGEDRLVYVDAGGQRLVFVPGDEVPDRVCD